MSEPTRQLRVQRMSWEAEDVLSLELADPAGHPLPAWEPGAHVDIVLGDGLVRQYSLCGRPTDSCYRIAVLYEDGGRGGSRWVHKRLRPGDLVDIRGPRNHFQLEEAPEYLFLAGGIGLTPILPMLAQVHASGSSWRLVYCGRARARMAFISELAQYGEHVSVIARDERERANLHVELANLHPEAMVYCCGPPELIDAVAHRCPDQNLQTERFAAPKVPQLPANACEVELASTGRAVTVPEGRSILEALLDEGLDVPNDCREGICGSCETKVLDGAVDHRDYVLTEKERCSGCTMMVCVSRPLHERLVLEV